MHISEERAVISYHWAGGSLPPLLKRRYRGTKVRKREFGLKYDLWSLGVGAMVPPRKEDGGEIL